jgi:hypothetical protein
VIHLLDPTVVAELIGVDDIHADEPFSPGPNLILAWARRTWPEADPVVRLDAEGRHAPPAADLPAWTRWVWARLVAHYFE